MDTSTPHSLAPELETRNRHKLHDRISKWIKRKAEQEELSTEVCSSTQSPSRTLPRHSRSHTSNVEEPFAIIGRQSEFLSPCLPPLHSPEANPIRQTEIFASSHSLVAATSSSRSTLSNFRARSTPADVILSSWPLMAARPSSSFDCDDVGQTDLNCSEAHTSKVEKSLQAALEPQRPVDMTLARTLDQSKHPSMPLRRAPERSHVRSGATEHSNSNSSSRSPLLDCLLQGTSRQSRPFMSSMESLSRQGADGESHADSSSELSVMQGGFSARFVRMEREAARRPAKSQKVDEHIQSRSQSTRGSSTEERCSIAHRSVRPARELPPAPSERARCGSNSLDEPIASPVQCQAASSIHRRRRIACHATSQQRSSAAPVVPQQTFPNTTLRASTSSWEPRSLHIPPRSSSASDRAHVRHVSASLEWPRNGLAGNRAAGSSTAACASSKDHDAPQSRQRPSTSCGAEQADMDDQTNLRVRGLRRLKSKASKLDLWSARPCTFASATRPPSSSERARSVDETASTALTALSYLGMTPACPTDRASFSTSHRRSRPSSCDDSATRSACKSRTNSTLLSATSSRSTHHTLRTFTPLSEISNPEQACQASDALRADQSASMGTDSRNSIGSCSASLEGRRGGGGGGRGSCSEQSRSKSSLSLAGGAQWLKSKTRFASTPAWEFCADADDDDDDALASASASASASNSNSNASSLALSLGGSQPDAMGMGMGMGSRARNVGPPAAPFGAGFGGSLAFTALSQASSTLNHLATSTSAALGKKRRSTNTSTSTTHHSTTLLLPSSSSFNAAAMQHKNVGQASKTALAHDAKSERERERERIPDSDDLREHLKRLPVMNQAQRIALLSRGPRNVPWDAL